MKSLEIKILIVLLGLSCFAWSFSLGDCDVNCSSNLYCYSDAYKIIYGTSIDFSKPGIHVVMDSSKSGGNFSYGWISFDDTSEVNVRFVPTIPIEGGPIDADWRECYSEVNKKHLDEVASLCIKNKKINDNLYGKIESFFSKKYMSIYDDNLGYKSKKMLYIMYVPQNGKPSYFRMFDISQRNDYLQSNAFFSEYIELFNGLKKILFSDFSECFWNNFGNVADLLRTCKKRPVQIDITEPARLQKK